MTTKKIKKSSLPRIGIIDLGTNSLRFDAYEFDGKDLHRTHREKKMIRLGDGVFTSGLIPEESFKKSVAAFSRIEFVCRELGIKKLYAFGTSALRSARNSKEFVETIRKETGISIRVISGVEEGTLIAQGVLANERLPRGLSALIDIGGGSTEVVLCRSGKIVEQHSFNLGANRLQQMFFQSIPPQMKKGNMHPELALRQYIRERLFGLSTARKWSQLDFAMGSSGTIRSLARILKKIGRESRRRSFERYDLSALVSEMRGMTKLQILRLPGLEPKRADLILAGAILLEELMVAMKIRRLSTTEYALRDGILVEARRRL